MANFHACTFRGEPYSYTEHHRRKGSMRRLPRSHPPPPADAQAHRISGRADAQAQDFSEVRGRDNVSVDSAQTRPASKSLFTTPLARPRDYAWHPSRASLTVGRGWGNAARIRRLGSMKGIHAAGHDRGRGVLELYIGVYWVGTRARGL